MLREAQAALLRRHGYEILEAADGQEAVEAFKANGREISVIVLDLSMPRMDGYEAFRAIRSIDPTARVILSSGYSERDAMRIVQGSSFSAFLQKPYDLSTLRAALEKIWPGPGNQPRP